MVSNHNSRTKDFENVLENTQFEKQTFFLGTN